MAKQQRDMMITSQAAQMLLYDQCIMEQIDPESMQSAAN